MYAIITAVRKHEEHLIQVLRTNFEAAVTLFWAATLFRANPIVRAV